MAKALGLNGGAIEEIFVYAEVQPVDQTTLDGLVATDGLVVGRVYRVTDNDLLVIAKTVNTYMSIGGTIPIFASGIVLQSPGGSYGLITIDDSGVLEVDFPYTPL